MDTFDRFQYTLFLVEQSIEQAKYERYVNECILMAEGSNNIQNITILNESFTDKLKEGIKKIVAAIGRIWAKFLEAMNNLLKTDKAYLEKYKDIILKKKMVDATYTMYDYPNALKSVLNKAAVPVFNFDEMSPKLGDDATFITYLAQKNGITINASSKEAFEDQLKTIFRGSPKEIAVKSAEINMTDMYNFCYNYDTIKSNLAKDVVNIKNGALAGIDLINKMVRNNEVQKTQPQQQTQQQTQQNQQQPKPNQQQQSQNASFNFFADPKNMYFSHISESYIHEMEKVTRDVDGTSSSGSTNATSNSSAADGDRYVNANQNKTGDEKQIDNDKSIQAGTATDKQAKENSDKIMRYLRITGQFLAAKQTVLEEIYKNYMTIIKLHVRDNVGNKDKDSDKGRDIGSDHNPPNQTQQSNTSGNKDKNDIHNLLNTDGSGI